MSLSEIDAESLLPGLVADGLIDIELAADLAGPRRIGETGPEYRARRAALADITAEFTDPADTTDPAELLAA